MTVQSCNCPNCGGDLARAEASGDYLQCWYCGSTLRADGSTVGQELAERIDRSSDVAKGIHRYWDNVKRGQAEDRLTWPDIINFYEHGLINWDECYERLLEIGYTTHESRLLMAQVHFRLGVEATP